MAAIAVMVVIVALCAASADAHAATPLHKLDRQLHRLVELGPVVAGPDGLLGEGPPGASAPVQRRGRVDFLWAGVADLRSGRPIRRNDHLRTASTAKTFSGAVALRLVDEGSLSLDSTIGETLPELPPAWGAVTLRQLLQHTNIVVGLMAEAATGQSYDELLRELVFEPLGLKHISIPDTLEIARPYMHGYDIAPPAPPDDVTKLINPSELWASGGMVSTPVDLNRFVRAYASGRLIKGNTRLQPRSFIRGAGGEPPGPGQNSGGLALYRYKANCGTVLGHTGNFLGYTVFIAATPNGRRSVVVSATERLSEHARPRIFKQARRTFRLAVCAALRR